MRKVLLTLTAALFAVISAAAQDFVWGTAAWNFEDGKSFSGIDEFNQQGLVLTYPNETNYTLTYFNAVRVEYDVFVDDAAEPIKASSSAQGGCAITFDYKFGEGHKYKIVTTSAVLVFANVATFTTDTLSVNTDSYSITFSIDGPEIVKTIDVEGTMALTIVNQEYQKTVSKVNADDITSALGIQSISEATVYGLNKNGSYNPYYMSEFDGWRDADGEFTTYWGGWNKVLGHNAYPAVYCIKLNEAADSVSYYFYDYWKEYDPNASDVVPGESTTRATAPTTSYNQIVWDWENEDGTITQYTRSYRVDEGSDYKASFIILANKKAVILNATLHFVSQEAYAEYIASQPVEYTGYIASSLATAQNPTQPMAANGEAQTVSVAAGSEEGTVKVTFSGFTFPMLPTYTGELTLDNITKTTAADGSITYSGAPVSIMIYKGTMGMPYTAELTGTQSSADADPVFVLKLSQATIIVAVFAADEAAAKSGIEAYYTAIPVESIKAEASESNEIFSTGGVRMTSPAKGVNIIKNGQKTIKVAQ